MNELASVIYQTEAGDQPGILGSQLHEALGVRTDYRHWFQRICLRLELKEGRDFTTLVKKVRRGDGVEMPGKKIDHAIWDIDILEAVDYYTTPRGQHRNSPNKVNLLSFSSIISFDAFRFAEKLLTQPLQIIIGEKPGGFGSYRDGYEIFHKAASTKKDLMVVENTSHYDLYDKPEPVRKAVAKLTSFFKENL